MADLKKAADFVTRLQGDLALANARLQVATDARKDGPSRRAYLVKELRKDISKAEDQLSKLSDRLTALRSALDHCLSPPSAEDVEAIRLERDTLERKYKAARAVLAVASEGIPVSVILGDQ